MARWQPVPIVGGAYSDETRPWSVQDTVNYLPQMAERAGTRSPSILRGAPGMVEFADLGTGLPIRGAHDVEGLLLAVSGRSLFRIDPDGTPHEIGTIPGVSRVSMAHNQIDAGHEVLIANGMSGYVYNTRTQGLTQITDSGFPGMRVVDFVDGYLAGVEPAGRYWFHSDLRKATEYNTLDRADAEASPDRIVGLIVSHREVMVMGQRSGQFFRNTGAATGTFQNANGTEMEVGLASPYAIARLDNTVYWLGHDGLIYRLNGNQPERVSVGPVEQAISRCDIGKAFAFTFEDRGHKVFYLTLPDGQTWGYDVWTGEFHRRESHGLSRWRVNTLTRSRGEWIAGDYANGKLYRLDWNAQHEAGNEMVRRRVTGVLHDEQNPVTLNAVSLVFDTGVSPVAAPPPRPHVKALKITGDHPNGIEGESMSEFAYQIVGGEAPIAVSLLSGALPPGRVMDSAGIVTGTPTLAGSFSWTVRAVDSGSRVADCADSAVVLGFAAFLSVNAGTGTVYRSDDLLTWGASSTSETGLGTWPNLLSGLNGALFAIGNGSGASSFDAGETWLPIADLPAKDPRAMAWTGTEWLLAVADGTDIYASSDGSTFVARPISDVSRSWYSIAVRNDVIVVGSTNGTGVRSNDGGVTWSAVTIRPASTSGVRCVIATPSGFLAFCGVGDAIYRSTDGISWTAVPSPPSPYVVHSAASGNGRIVAVMTSTHTLVSEDGGSTWSLGNLPALINGTAVNPLIFARGYFILAAMSGKILVSSNGIDWAETADIGGPDGLSICAMRGGL